MYNVTYVFLSFNAIELRGALSSIWDKIDKTNQCFPNKNK